MDAFDRAKRLLLLACAGIAGGLAVAGSLDQTTGGVIVLAGWLAAVVALHRIGRSGADSLAAPKLDLAPKDDDAKVGS